MSAFPVGGKLRFDNSLGAMLNGLLVSTALFGLTTLQTYLYYANYRGDKAIHKWLVGILWMLDFAHTILISHSAYYFLVQQYGNPLALLEGEWSIIVEVAVTACVTVLVQCFLAHRIYRLSEGNWMVAGTIFIIALAVAGLGMASTIRLFQIAVFVRLPEVLGILSATLIVMAVNDVLITVALCWFLQKAQKPAGGHDAVSLLIVYTIETGMLTSIFVTVTAVCLLTMPHNWVFIGLEFCVSKLYANSLLTILNSRRSVRRMFHAKPSTSTLRTSVLDPPIAIGHIQVTTEEYSQTETATAEPDMIRSGKSTKCSYLVDDQEDISWQDQSLPPSLFANQGDSRIEVV